MAMLAIYRNRDDPGNSYGLGIRGFRVKGSLGRFGDSSLIITKKLVVVCMHGFFREADECVHVLRLETLGFYQNARKAKLVRHNFYRQCMLSARYRMKG